jgi:hypothetical protein
MNQKRQAAQNTAVCLRNAKNELRSAENFAKETGDNIIRNRSTFVHDDIR